MKMKEVFSSNVNKVGYDEDTKEFHVEWANGKRSIYSGVTPQQANGISTSWSVGGAIEEVLKKPNVPHRYG